MGVTKPDPGEGSTEDAKELHESQDAINNANKAVGRSQRRRQPAQGGAPPLTDDELHIELAALGRLSSDLQRLGMSLKTASEKPWVTTGPAFEMPSVAAARQVSIDTIPGLQETVADRFTELRYLVDHARTRFSEADDNRVRLFASAGTMLDADRAPELYPFGPPR